MGRFLKYALLVATALLCVSVQPLRADTMDQFTYTAGGNTFTWQLPPSPTAFTSQLVNDHFGVMATITENGPSLCPDTVLCAEITFLSDSNPGSGGLEINVGGQLLAFALGDIQLYSGPLDNPESAPTFLPVTNAQLEDFVIDPLGGPAGQAFVTISEVSVAPVPEPSSILLLGSGLLVVVLGLAIKKASN